MITPGPWKIRSEPGACSGDDPNEGWWYTLHAKADNNTFLEHEANARLMQQAPKLKAELEAVAAYLDALHDNMIENDVDMMIDKNESPKVIADRIRKVLKPTNPQS